MKKLKVVWICTFSNTEKRSHLSLWRKSQSEVGQWIPNLLMKFKDYAAELEVHVISVEPWMRRKYESWTEEGVTFHCIPESMPIVGIAWPRILPLDALTQYAVNSRRIQRIVESINPDIIHLFGAEIAQYSASVLAMRSRFPVLVCIQGFIFREPCFPSTVHKTVRVMVENQILQTFRFFCGEYESRDVVRVFNRSSQFFPLYYPINESLAMQTRKDLSKKYDLLFVGKIRVQKGIIDFVKMVARLRDKGRLVNAAIVGSIDKYAPLRALLKSLRLSDEITFLPRFPSQAGLFELYQQSRLFVAPTYNDCFPSTIRECAFLGIPVLAYATGGIPYANQNGKENVVLVEQGNVEGLADKAFEILESDTYQNTLSQNLRQLAAEEFSLDRNVSRIRAAYEAILNESRKGGENELSHTVV